LQENYEESINLKVPRELHRIILGGGKIKELNQTLNVIIRFPDRESKSENILIRGKQSLLPEAEKAFLLLVEEAKTKSEAPPTPGARAPREAAHSETININPSFMGRIIGRGGSTIRELSDISQARIDLNKDSGTITLSGTKEAVEFAIKELNALIKDIQVHFFHLI
jgi:predicted PilT family ATPase